MTAYQFNPAKLRTCPECGGRWPNGPDFSLRGCDWLHGLPNKISPSNNDVLIHDYHHGPDRFLQLEMKGLREKWPLAHGQSATLMALARQPRWTVRILRGTSKALTIHHVSSVGIDELGVKSHAEAIRRTVALFLNGEAWRDPVGEVGSGHTCGWARVEGVWTCIQDYHAIGFAPETACGATSEGTK